MTAAADRTQHFAEVSSDPLIASSSASEAHLAAVTLGLHSAIAANDSDRTSQQMLDLLGLASSVRHSRESLPGAMQLVELTVKALQCCSNSAQAQQAGCQLLRILGEAAEVSEQPASDQVQQQALHAVAKSMLGFAADKTLQSYGVAAMLSLAQCNMRAVAPGVYDLNSTDKEGCTVLHKLARFNLPDCLSVIIQACGTRLDFRHKCNNGQTAVMVAEELQHAACVDILDKASQGSYTAPPPQLSSPPPEPQQSQSASLEGPAHASFPLSQQLSQQLLQLDLSQGQNRHFLQLQQQLQHRQQQQHETSGMLPGLYPLLSNIQGHTDAMLQLGMQSGNPYPFQQHLAPGLAAPALSRPGHIMVPPGREPASAAPSAAASQRTSMESAYTGARPSLDDVSMLSHMYPSSSLDSAVSQQRMSVDQASSQRLSSSSRPSSTWSPYYGLNTHFQSSSPWPSRLARAFSDEPTVASGRPSRESVDGAMSLDEPQSAVSASSAMPQPLSGPIAEEEASPPEAEAESQEEQGKQQQQQEPDWASAAEADWNEAAAAAAVAAAQMPSSSGAVAGAGQAWNWPWAAAQHALHGGFLDPDALLDDESEGASKHLWLGNLNTRLPRAVLKAVFEQHGPVDDVVTFPGRMYAFVNFQQSEDAARAQEALDGKVVASLSGGRRLTVRFRPSKRALGKLSEGHPDAQDSPAISQLKEFEGQQAEAGLLQGPRAGEWEGSSTPSNRVWLGNISATATLRSVRSVFSKFGPLTDAAVFPARIGPLGYAFVNFERVVDAAGAYQALNNVVLPALTGCKQLKMRFKPAKGNTSEMSRGNSASLEADWEGSLLEASQPSRHLLLGNISSRPNENALETVFGKFGPLEAVKVFPGKTYALVSFKEVAPAAEAMQCLDGHSLLSVSGQKPLVIRYQSGSGGQATALSATGPEELINSPSGAAAVGPSAAAPAAADAASKASSTATAGQPRSARTLFSGDEEESDDDSLMPAVNLSNRLNPNNVHFDRQLAAQYKRMSKHEKEALWAADRARQHQLRELTELSQMAGLSATELTQLTELTQAAMLNQPSADMGANLLSQLGPYFSKPGVGLPPAVPWEGGLPPQGPPGAFPANPALPQVGLNDAALTGAASGLQAAAQSLLRQRMEGLRQQGVGLRGGAGPRGWDAEVPDGHHHGQGLPFGAPGNPAYWQPPAGQSLMRSAQPSLPNLPHPPFFPQHLSQRSRSHPPVGPPPGAYGPYRPQQGFGLHLQPQQEQQALEAQAQAQLHQALENQARQAAEQQLQSFHSRQAPPLGEALRDRTPSFGAEVSQSPWPRPASDPFSLSQHSSEQQRKMAELFASGQLQRSGSGFRTGSSQQPPGWPPQHLTHPLDQYQQDQAHRVSSWGAVSAPERSDQMNIEQHYRLASLQSLSSPETPALSQQDSVNQEIQHQPGPNNLSGNMAYSGNQFRQQSQSLAPGANLPNLQDWSTQL